MVGLIRFIKLINSLKGSVFLVFVFVSLFVVVVFCCFCFRLFVCCVCLFVYLYVCVLMLLLLLLTHFSLFLVRINPLNAYPVLLYILSPETDNCLLESAEWRQWPLKIFHKQSPRQNVTELYNKRVITLILVNIIPSWDIKGYLQGHFFWYPNSWQYSPISA